MTSRRGTCWWRDLGPFSLWALTGITGCATVAGILTVGVFLMPITGVLLGVAILLTGRRPHREFTVVGLLLGPALVVPFLGWVLATADMVDGHTPFDWSMFLPFAGVGLACLVVGLTTFVVLGRRVHGAPPVAGHAADGARPLISGLTGTGVTVAATMADTRTKLLEASVDVLRTDGIAGVSARAIATRAGVNQALVFYHFGTLDALVAASARHAVDELAEHYRQLFAAVDSLSQLLQLGRELHRTEQAAGNVAIMAQLMAGAQRNSELAAAVRYSMDRWIAEIEQVVNRVFESSVLSDVAESRGLAGAVCASFIGLELYDGIDSDGGEAALDALTRLAVLADALDGLGPVARRAVAARLRAGERRRPGIG